MPNIEKINKADDKKSNLADEKKSNLTDVEIDLANENDFMNDVNQESINKMVKAGLILPQLKPKLDTVYTVKILGNLSTFTSEFGKAYALEIFHNDMRKQIVFNPQGSFHTQLVALLTIMKLKLSEAKGKMIAIQKSIGSTKKFKDVELYSIQFVN